MILIAYFTKTLIILKNELLNSPENEKESSVSWIKNGCFWDSFRFCLLGIFLTCTSLSYAQEAMFPLGSYTPRILIVSFRADVSDTDVLNTILNNGTEIVHVSTFVNEDTNGNGLLDADEDENNNEELDKVVIYTLEIVDQAVLAVTDPVPEEVVLSRFTSDSNVESASLDFYAYPLDHLPQPNDPLFAHQWALRNNGQSAEGTIGIINADQDARQGWSHSTGSRGIVVAIIDDGFDMGHPDLVGNLFSNTKETGGKANIDDDGCGVIDDTQGADFSTLGVPTGNPSFTPGDEDNAPLNDINNPPGFRDYDRNGNGVFDPPLWPKVGDVDRNGNGIYEPGSSHGTHVAGIIGAMGNTKIGISGVNWRVTMLLIKGIRISSVVRAGAYLARLKGKGHNIRVVNYSAGASPINFPPGASGFQVWNLLQNAQRSYTTTLNGLNAAGILFVTAAHNDDRAGNGIDMDSVSPEDLDADGALDPGEDLNGNGLLDPPGSDNFGNGMLDAGEDLDGDGILDPGEDQPEESLIVG